jgi:hypothetical protein
MVTQGLAYLDKTATNYANLFGIRTSLHITQAQFVSLLPGAGSCYQLIQTTGLVRFSLLHRLSRLCLARESDAPEVLSL